MTTTINLDLDDYENLLDIMNKADEIVKFCYAQDGCWIGRETISKSPKFTELVADLRDLIYPTDTEST